MESEEPSGVEKILTYRLSWKWLSILITKQKIHYMEYSKHCNRNNRHMSEQKIKTKVNK
jgi:hypothetical protein